MIRYNNISRLVHDPPAQNLGSQPPPPRIDAPVVGCPVTWATVHSPNFYICEYFSLLAMTQTAQFGTDWSWRNQNLRSPTRTDQRNEYMRVAAAWIAYLIGPAKNVPLKSYHPVTHSGCGRWAGDSTQGIWIKVLEENTQEGLQVEHSCM